MIIINYQTNSKYNETIWTYHCKTRRSAKKQLIDLMNIDDYGQDTIEEVKHNFNKATAYRFCNTKIHIQKVRSDWSDLYIKIQEINLI